MDDVIPKPVVFVWDRGNIDKNYKRHGVANEEAEEVFLNNPLVFDDVKHSTKVEKRYFCLGVADKKKKLFVSFTTRGKKVRIISARTMSRKERRTYEKVKANT